ncbi:MAG: DUF5686 family protein [Bacteroidetes bacterium]|nr:DUF5686 family protein [Bacteroidota bacterium]
MIKQLLLFLFVCQIVIAQEIRIKGIVIDAKDNVPLPQASVRLKGQTSGTITDMEGRFSLRLKSSSDTLMVSMIGYETVIVPPKNTTITIKLRQKVNELAEVRVRPGENPAWAIIRKVLANRPQNDPNQLDTYKASAYTKILLVVDSVNRVLRDSTKKVIGSKKITAPIYIVENISELIHKKPNKNKETVVASVNNLAQIYSQMLNYLPLDLHKIDFYSELYNFTLLKRFYVNPLNSKTFSQYDFTLEDTLFHERDSTFIISFRPYPKTNFDALQGVMHINTDGYALEYINVAPVDTLQNFGFRIQQRYQRIAGRWFPQTATTRLLAGYSSSGYTGAFQVKFTTQLHNVELNTPLDDQLFDEVQRAMRPSATRHTYETFKALRPDTLADWERKMYFSFKKPNGLASRLDSMYGHILGSFFANVFEIGPIELQPSDFMVGNSIEYVRLGVGFQNIQSNRPRFRLYGYAGYGLKDQRWKYKLLASWHITRDRYNRLSIYHQRDLAQPGTTEFLGPNYLIDPKPSLPFFSQRDSIPFQADYYQRYGVSLHFKPFPWNWFRLALHHEQRTPSYRYFYQDNNTFEITELTLDWRFAFREAVYRTGRMESVVNRYFPIINVQVSRGLPSLGSQFEYWRLVMQLYFQFRTRRLGFSNVKLAGGYTSGDLPYSYLFGSLGSTGLINISGLNASSFPLATFRTLPSYAFIADRYAALYYSHDFSRTLLRLKSKYSQPRLLVYNNVLVGGLRTPEKHSFSWNYQSNPFHAEAGLEVRDLLRIPIRSIFLGTGMGVAYQYAPAPAGLWQNNAKAYWLGINLSR